MNKLYLIGESHFDLDSSQRTKLVFAALKPVKVGIEEAENDFKEYLHTAQQPEAVANAIVNWKRRYPDANGETLELIIRNVINRTLLASVYQQESKLLFCDNPEVVESPAFEHALSEYIPRPDRILAQFVRMAPEEARQMTAREYSETTYTVADSPALVKFYSERDKFAAEKLRVEALRLAAGVFVYFCGLDHLYGDYHPNLFDRLVDLNPVRMKLNDADKLPKIQ